MLTDLFMGFFYLLAFSPSPLGLVSCIQWLAEACMNTPDLMSIMHSKS